MSITIDSAQNTLQTSDALKTSAVTYSLIANCCAKVTITVLGINTSNGDSIGGEFKIIVKRGTSSSSMLGPLLTNLNQLDSSLASAAIGFETNGTSMAVTVAGVGGQTINWMARMDLIILN